MSVCRKSDNNIQSVCLECQKASRFLSEADSILLSLCAECAFFCLLSLYQRYKENIKPNKKHTHITAAFSLSCFWHP